MAARPRLNLRQELTLALLPTLVVLIMLGGVEAFSRQRLLFASLASSAFLIYLDPEHPSNGVRTVVLAQGCAALFGFGADWLLGAGYFAAGVAMVVTIVVIIALDVMHPPAVSTALTFAFRAAPGQQPVALWLFAVLLIVHCSWRLQHASLWLLRRYRLAADAFRKLRRLLPWRTRPRPKKSSSRSPCTGCAWRSRPRGPWSSGFGVGIALVAFARSLLAGKPADFNAIRLVLARYLAMALEFQLGADILSTAVAPSWNEIGKLGAIAVIRTTLELFSLQGDGGGAAHRRRRADGGE